MVRGLAGAATGGDGGFCFEGWATAWAGAEVDGALSRMKGVNKMNINLTINEIYAMQGIIIGLEGLTKRICQDFSVNNMELLEKLEAITDAWLKEHHGTPT